MNEKENKNRRDLYLKIRVSREELDARAKFSDLQGTSQAISIRSLSVQTAAAEFTMMILLRSRKG